MEQVKLLLFTDAILKTLRDFTQKILNSFSKVAGYKNQHTTSSIFLCANNERNQVNNPVISLKKYLRIKLIKEVKNLRNENYKTLKKTLEDGKTSHVHGSAESVLCKWLYITESNLQIQCNPYCYSNDILHKNRESKSKNYMEA
jgi:hypothetical protein